MTVNKLRIFFILGTMLATFMLVIGFNVSAAVVMPTYKEYRNGSAVIIDGQTYLLLTNNSSVEILQFNQANSLTQVSELRLAQKIKDVVTVNEGKEAYAIVTTGRYLYRIRITDPRNMQVVLKHDNYQYSRGRIRTGSVESLATNGKYLYTAGQYGVRRMNLSNLIVDKYYYYDKAYGLAVNDQAVFVIGENKAYGFNLATGNKLMEVELKNIDKQLRRPAVSKHNEGYVISDNAIIKMFDNQKTVYTNPTPKVSFSYGATMIDKTVYYANGYGVTKFDNNLEKTGFLKTSATNRFGDRSWAVGVLAVKVNGSDKLIVLNKSSILVLSPSLALISQYRDINNVLHNPGLTVNFDRQYFMTNQAIAARLAGFWPNEIIKLSIGDKVYQGKANNLGEAMISFMTPSTPKRYLVDISAQSSLMTYQETRDVK